MAEYIERKALLDRLSGVYGDYAMEVVEEFPSADVEPVVHGEWIDGGDILSCSVCHATRMKEFESYYGKVTRAIPNSRYCPTCGARMDGGSNG